MLTGKKVVEIRRWFPPEIPFLDLVLVENEIYLTEEGQVDPNGLARAIVDITGVHEWTREEAESQGMDWLPNYVCWELSNVRPYSSTDSIVLHDGRFIKLILTLAYLLAVQVRAIYGEL